MQVNYTYIYLAYVEFVIILNTNGIELAAGLHVAHQSNWRHA